MNTESNYSTSGTYRRSSSGPTTAEKILSGDMHPYARTNGQKNMLRGIGAGLVGVVVLGGCAAIFLGENGSPESESIVMPLTSSEPDSSTPLTPISTIEEPIANEPQYLSPTTTEPYSNEPAEEQVASVTETTVVNPEQLNWPTATVAEYPETHMIEEEIDETVPPETVAETTTVPPTTEPIVVTTEPVVPVTEAPVIEAPVAEQTPDYSSLDCSAKYVYPKSGWAFGGIAEICGYAQETLLAMNPHITDPNLIITGVTKIRIN
jgi:hypothetical protein